MAALNRAPQRGNEDPLALLQPPAHVSSRSAGHDGPPVSEARMERFRLLRGSQFATAAESLPRRRPPSPTAATSTPWRALSVLRWRRLAPFLHVPGNAFADAQTIRTTLRLVNRHGLQSLHAKAAVSSATRVFEVAGAYNCREQEDSVHHRSTRQTAA